MDPKLELTDKQWIPHQRDTWPYRYGELKHPIEFERYTGKYNNKGEQIVKKEMVKAGTTVKIVMVSRFEDVGITDILTNEHGYQTRGLRIEELDKHLLNLRLEL